VTERVVDNLFLPKTKHEWRSSDCGYDPADYCTHCGANNYQSYGTKTCEEYKQKLVEIEQKKLGTHEPTNEALRVARSALTREQWDLLGLSTYMFQKSWPYREVDLLKV